jgi:hypothetical protein
VQSPHFRPDGKTVHNGLYEAVLPLVTAECLWGKAINSASQLKIEVFETASGETKTASTSISVSGESLLIRASGFSYSIPTIRVRLAEVTTTTSSSTTTTSRQIVKTTFTKATGVSYSATAKKGKTTARFTCKTIKQTVTCTSQKLARGSWILTVTPSKNGTKGAETKKSIKIT